MKWKLVPTEIDRETCRPMLDVWNDGMERMETLEMLWPKLLAAARAWARQENAWAAKREDSCRWWRWRVVRVRETVRVVR